MRGLLGQTSNIRPAVPDVRFGCCCREPCPSLHLASHRGASITYDTLGQSLRSKRDQVQAPAKVQLNRRSMTWDKSLNNANLHRDLALTILGMNGSSPSPAKPVTQLAGPAKRPAKKWACGFNHWGEPTVIGPSNPDGSVSIPCPECHPGASLGCQSARIHPCHACSPVSLRVLIIVTLADPHRKGKTQER
jgi:hypothetical protein